MESMCEDQRRLTREPDSVTYMNLADAMCINFLVPTLTAFVSYVWLRVS